MKVLPFKIPKTIESSIRVQVDNQPYFYDTLHQHPEIQITLIVAGSGTLFQGAYIGEYTSGDVFVIGANIPHVLKSDVLHYQDETQISHAISIFFTEDSLGSGFFQLPELKAALQLLSHANRGIKLYGHCKQQVGELIQQISSKHLIDKVITLLQILNSISSTGDISYLTNNYTQQSIDETEGARLNSIFQFTLREYYRTIKLEEVANMANMSVPAFCRYFKQRTRKTYINFLTDIRIAQAGKLLLNHDENIAQIAYQCGFGNLSHFNRVFKKAHNRTPREFQKSRVKFI